ncbi:MAG: amidohydrolase family protein [Alphaproteobacteria bacterium]|nr:amidohydrolase family protein [Alphaproteobacteria bacterium]
MNIDAHQHFWRLDRGDYGWLTPAKGPIYRDFGPADLRPILDRHAIARTILVQAAATLTETEYMLGIAADTPCVAGVVGWVDFASADGPATVHRLARNPLLVGLRPMLQDIPDDDWLLRRDIEPTVRAMEEIGLVFDALVRPRHLSRLLAFIDRHPRLRIVVDHGGKPAIATRQADSWHADMAAVAARSDIMCKLSGLVTEAGADWQPRDLKPYVDHILATFGPQRTLWGSDWPVVNLAGGYDRWRAATLELTAALANADRSALFGGNAERLYLTGRGRK